MTIIAEISNNEAGNSVRFKLNQVISAINAGNLTNTILSGQGVPNNALGKNGDFYINLLSLEFYGPKVGNAWPLPGISLIGPKGDPGDPGLDGLDGTDGSTILSGSGVPGVELGLDGDYYFDSLNIDFYGPKTAGIWGTGSSLVGPPGDPGIGLVPSGEYDPLRLYEANEMVSYEGSSYVAIQSTTGNLPTNATYWLVVANKGIDGIDGTNGIDGVDGLNGTDGRTILPTTGVPGAELGEDGDFALDPAASLLYGPKTAGAWGSPVSIKGDPGVNGRTILNGTGIPGAEIGVDGDFYLNTTANDIYGPKTAGAWGSATSLIGPTGASGSVSAASGLTLEHIATPSAPAAGNTIVYAKDDGLIYRRAAGGGEEVIGSGGGGDTGTPIIPSGSTSGLGILIADTSGIGTLIHTAHATERDELAIYATNNHSGAVDVTLQVGGTDAQHLRTVSIPNRNGPHPIYPGIPLTSSTEVRAIAGVANVVVIDASIDRLSSGLYPSGSTSGLGILIADTSGIGTIIHTVPASTTQEIALYATNNHSGAVDVTLQVGGTDAQHLRTVSIPNRNGPHPIYPGIRITGETVIRAIAGVANVVVIDAVIGSI